MQLMALDSPRDEAQELMWQAMDTICDDPAAAARLCRAALKVYPDCVDAHAMLAELNSPTPQEYVKKLRAAIEAGRRDLGPKFFKREMGYFWGLIETRPFMRAMADLVFALLGLGTPEHVDEAIEFMEEMLELNPNDNQGVRDWLGGCYLARKRYDDADALFKRYPDDWLASPAWLRVLLAHVKKDEAAAVRLLAEARELNPFVEKYLTGEKRRPRTWPDSYSPGDENEAKYSAHLLLDSWNAHPDAVAWLRRQGKARATPARRSKTSRR